MTMTQTSGIQGGPEMGTVHGHIRELGIPIGEARGGNTDLVKTSLSARENTGEVDGDAVCGQAHKIANANEIADTRATTSGPRQQNEARTGTLTAVSVADENTDDTRAETTRRTTNVDGEQAAHRTRSKTKIPHLTNTATLHPF